MKGEKAALLLSRNLVAYSSAEELLGRIRHWITAATPHCLVHPLGFFVVLLRRLMRKNGGFMYGRKVREKLLGYRHQYTLTTK